MTSRRAGIAYCIAHVGKRLLWTASDLLTFYLLVSVYRIDPIVAGGLFLAGLAAGHGPRALLAALADGPRGYGLYTMASKLALGVAGLALAGGLGRVPTFAAGVFPIFVGVVAAPCLLAALLAWPHLTPARARAFSRR